MYYRYPDEIIDVAKQYVYEGITYPSSILSRRSGETDAVYGARLNSIGVYPVRYIPSTHDATTQARGPEVTEVIDGWWVISYPVPIDLTHCWSKTTQAEAWQLSPIPDEYTTEEPPGACYEWVNGTGWVCQIAENTAMDKAVRDKKLDECQWMVNRHRDQVDNSESTSLSGAEYTELLTFRKSLRDLPAQDVDSRNWVWPTEPVFIEYKPL